MLSMDTETPTDYYKILPTKDLIDVNKIEECLEDAFGSIKNKNDILSYIRKHSYVAGGFFKSIFNGNEPKDIDIYFKSMGLLNGFKELILPEDNYKFIIFDTSINIRKVQIINDIAGDPVYILSKFDFVHTQVYYDFKERCPYLSKATLASIAMQEVVFTNSTDYPISSLLRCLKLSSDGWRVSNYTILSIVKSILNIPKDKIHYQLKSPSFKELNKMYAEKCVTEDVNEYISFILATGGDRLDGIENS